MKKSAIVLFAISLIAPLSALPGAVAPAAPDSWDAPIDISEPSQNAGNQHVVTDGTTMTAIWYRFDGNLYSIQSSFSVDAGATWSVPIAVSDAGQAASAPQIVTDGTTITAIWARFDGNTNRVQSAFSVDAGASWSVPVTVSDAGEEGLEPRLVTDGNTTTAVWYRFDGSGYQVESASSTDAGVSWSAPVRVSEAGQDAYEPQLVSDGTTITAIWYRQNGSDFRIETASSVDAGISWSPPVTVSDVGQGAGNQHLATDGTTITAIWYRFDGSFDAVQSASSLDAGVSWSEPVTISEAGDSAGSPQLATDGATITAIWQRIDGGRFRIESSSSTDAGVTWSVPVALSDAGENAFSPQLVTDGTTISAAWYAFDGSIHRVQSAFSTDAGVTWSVPVTVSDEGEDAFEPQLVTDGATVTAIWYRYDGSLYTVQTSSFRAVAPSPTTAIPGSPVWVLLLALALVVLIGGATVLGLRSHRRRRAARALASPNSDAGDGTAV